MVTKLCSQTIHTTYQFCSSEKINGNKTLDSMVCMGIMFCSSEKINGNKTVCAVVGCTLVFCSSEKINGNKTSNSYYHKFKIL